MADVKDSALQIVASVLGAQEWGVNDAGVSRRITNDLVKAYVVAPSTGFPGVLTREQFTSNTGTVSFPNNASANSPFAAANDTFTLQPGTYFFDGLYHLTGMGATTRTTATLFSGTATLTSITYRALIQTGAANALSTAQSTKTCVTATANVLNATVTTAAEAIEIRCGIVRVSVAGTFIPQIQHSADPTGTILAQTNCHFRIHRVADNTTAFVGDVS